MSKKRVLFIVEDFYNAGAERFTYEVNRALNKEKFEVDIFCLAKKDEVSKLWGERYFENLHLDLGSKIIYADKFLKRSLFDIEFIYRISKRLGFVPNKKNNYKKIFYQFLNSYDVLHWMGEYTFIHSIPESIKNKSLIHSMSAKFQNPNIYKKYDHHYTYNFISGFYADEAEYDEFKKINHYFFPLLLKINHESISWTYPKSENYKIGIFTRLSSYKPLDPFFYSFKLLTEKLPNCSLHIYGNGDPEREGFTRYLKTLGIQDKVFFEGHQENITETATNSNLHLSWFQGYNNDRPAGYAGFDICSVGLPLICWDFVEKQTNPFNETYPHYKNLTLFVEKTIQLLTDRNKAEELSEKQFTDILENRDIDKHIWSLENIYERIILENER